MVSLLRTGRRSSEPSPAGMSKGFMGNKMVKMCVYGEGFGIRLSHPCFRCENYGFRCLKCVFMGNKM